MDQSKMTLSELILSTKGDRSYADLERAGRGTPLASRWHQLATTTLRNFPDPPTITGIARALQMREWQVIAACARSLGFPVPVESKLEYLMPPGTENLTDEQIAAVLSVIRVMRRDSSARPSTPVGPTP